MKILLVSYFFPPYNSIGAVRVGKTAKYLTCLGHEVRVISAKDQPLLQTLPLEIDPQYVHYTKSFNINMPVELFLGGRQQLLQKGYSEYKTRKGIVASLGNLYKLLFHVPDPQIGWYPFAVQKGMDIIDQWMPDIILSSATPYTSHLISYSIATRISIPWVGEFRDLWTDNHYRKFPQWRSLWEKKLEYHIMSSAHGLITVSDALAKKLSETYTCPVEVIYNGFDRKDYPSRIETDHKWLSIVYTGSLYEGKRDITLLFDALKLIPEISERVRVHLYGYGHNNIVRMARNIGLGDLFIDHGMVSYPESLQSQVNADLLLLILWDDPREKGVLTGKLFEYIGAGRPILCISPSDTEAAQLIIEKGLGIVSNDSQSIAAYITDIANHKTDGIHNYNLQPSLSEEFSRLRQTEKLAAFLNGLRK